jgi:uncharacterized protein (DUF427 family)
MILFRHACAKAIHKIEVDNLDRLYSGHGAASIYTVSTSHAAKCDEHWFYRHTSHENIALETSSEIV